MGRDVEGRDGATAGWLGPTLTSRLLRRIRHVVASRQAISRSARIVRLIEFFARGSAVLDPDDMS